MSVMNENGFCSAKFRNMGLVGWVTIFWRNPQIGVLAPFRGK